MSGVEKINITFDNEGIKKFNNFTNSVFNSSSSSSSFSTNNKIEELNLEEINFDKIEQKAKTSEDIGTKIGNALLDLGEKAEDTASKIGKKVTSLVDDLPSEVKELEKVWEKDIWPVLKDGNEKIDEFVENSRATVALFATSILGEGIATVGESIVDLGAIVGTAVATPITGIADAGQALQGLITGEDWESETKKLWEETKGFVSEKWVSSWFDSFYKDTEIGKWMKENAFFSEGVRSIGSGIGYVAGVVGLTVATFGIGGAVIGGGAASTGAAGVTSAQLATTAGALGVGKGTETSWADGAGITEGLAYGTANGLWEGLQFFAGAKIGGSKLFGEGGKFLTNLSANEIKTKAMNSAARVMLDGADGGVEGFIQPLLGGIYKEGSYEDLFKEYGGWNNVATQAAIGSGMSILGEGFDLTKYLKQGKNVKASTNTGLNEKNTSPKQSELEKNVLEPLPSLIYIEKKTTPKQSTLALELEKKLAKELPTMMADETRKKIENIKQPDLTKYQKYVDRANRISENINKLEIVDNLAYKEVNPFQIVDRIENKIFELNKNPEIISFGTDVSACKSYFEHDNNQNYSFFQSMPGKVQDAIILYTSNHGYDEINNNFLRKYKGQIDDKPDILHGSSLKDIVKQLDYIVERTPLPQDMILYRGCNINQFKDLGLGHLDDLKMLTGANLVLNDYGIMSTSPIITNGFVQWSDIVLVIKAEKGTHCSFVDPISNFSGEDEVILERGQKGIISGVEKIGKQYFVYMELLPKEKTDTNITEVNELKSTVSNKIKAPEISSKNDLETYLTDEFIIKNDNLKVYREEINTTVDAINNYINHQIENKKTPLDEVYYLLLEMTGWEMNQDIKTDIISNLINSNQKIREALSENAKTEISLSLENTFGITDENMVNEVYNCLVGSEFVDKGIGANADWDKYIDIIKPYTTEKVQILSKEKEPVLWSKIENDYHPILNEKYTTIENSTIGEDMYFLDLMYSNWDRQTTSIPPLENLWAKLSKIYADACCEVKNPITNVNVDTISYLYPETINVENSFGKLFKTIEFPEVLHNGTIKNINLTKVNPTTLEPVSTETVDISDIIDYYQNTNCGMQLEDISSNEEAFKIFLNKIKGEK